MKNTLYGLLEWIEEERFSLEYTDEYTQEPKYLDNVVYADELKERIRRLIRKVKRMIRESDCVSAETISKKILGERAEFGAYEMGEIKGNLSRKEIYEDR